MNLTKCKRCGNDISGGQRDTNRKFCSSDCRDTYWNEVRTKGLTIKDRHDRMEAIAKIELTEAQAAWVAALLDGEGTIGVYRRRKQGNRSGFYYQPIVSVGNTCEALITRFNELVNSNATSTRQNGSKPTNKEIFYTHVYQRAVPELLLQLLPHLIAKRRQAELVIKFCEVKWSMGWREDGHEIYEHFYHETLALNKRGVKQDTPVPV